MSYSFHKADRDKVIGGAARILYQQTTAEHGGAVAYPTKIGDVINTTTFAAQVANGWRDFGQTVDGITIARALGLTTWDTDQIAEVNEAVDRWTHTVATNLAETTLENLKLAWEGGAIAAVPGGLPGERYVPFGAPTTLTERALVVIFRDHMDYLWMWAFRKAKLNTAGEIVYTRGTMERCPVTWKLYADTSINNENDQVWRVYSDSPATTSTSTTTSTTSSTSTSTTSTTSTSSSTSTTTTL